MSLFSATETGFFARMSRAISPFEPAHLRYLQPASENGGIYVTDKEFEYYS